MGLEKAFGDTLRALRTSKGFSQESLALECELDRTYISMLERGVRSPSLKTIFLLSEPLKVSPTKFIELVETRMLKEAP